MSWLTSGWSSTLLGTLPRRPARMARERQMLAIRQAMLEALGDAALGQAAVLARRIRYAGDAQRLWYLRSELMEALAALRGEATARQSLSTITPLFHGALPQGLARRLGTEFAPR